MRNIIVVILLSVFASVVCITSCKHKPQQQAPDGNFPADIAKIFVSKCATVGCHDQASYAPGAGSLLLDSWTGLFAGGISGAVVIAYDTIFSPLLYYVNTDPTLGTVVNDPPHNTLLTRAEYETLTKWIKSGAPDKNGNIPFASNPDTRQKIYLTNQGCNLVAVIDAQSRVVMRYIHVGGPNDVTPHDVRVSSDGMYAYVSIYDGHYVDKIDTRTDTVIGSVNLSPATSGGVEGGWSIINLSPQDTAFIVSGYLTNSMVTVNTGTMQFEPKRSLDEVTGGSNYLAYPHGMASNAAFDTFYTALQYGNEIMKYSFSHPFFNKYISVDGLLAGHTDSGSASGPNPHFIEMLPDYSKYFVACQHTQGVPGTVSVIDAHTDTVITQITVGSYPQEMALCTSKNYLFVVCMEDFDNRPSTSAGPHGSVYVIDYNTLQVVTKLYGDFSEPHDIAVDNKDGLLFIANRNADGNGVVSHHSTSCGGNAGWYTVYNLNTLQPDTKRYEVTNDAYAISPRFK